MKKVFFVLLLTLISSFLIACGGYSPSDNWVLEKSRLGESTEIENYVSSVQDSPDFRGFGVFTIAEGREMVIVSTGEADKLLELVDVKVVSGNTKIILSEIEKKSSEVNPYIMVGLGAIKGELFVENTDGRSF